MSHTIWVHTSTWRRPGPRSGHLRNSHWVSSRFKCSRFEPERQRDREKDRERDRQTDRNARPSFAMTEKKTRNDRPLRRRYGSTSQVVIPHLLL